ncbi:hypothetical protein ACTVZO_07350 [Streptomyces sp. IBSNAI002]|uniref:hypothetical protein n=1 Tax=Streptomyces sp. IBSNAI002 TaxID=3457500 RepID=UPI003FD2697E
MARSSFDTATRIGGREPVVVRPFSDGDSVADLTRLLHRAYSGHAAEGRVFFASYQSVQDTAYRLSRGECWVVLQGSELAGTVTVAAAYEAPEGYPAGEGRGRSGSWPWTPRTGGSGLGQRLLSLAEERIAALGSDAVVIDTSVAAAELIGRLDGGAMSRYSPQRSA